MRRVLDHERPDVIEIGSPAIVPWVNANLPYHDWHVIPGALDISIPGLIGAALVYFVGKWWQKRASAKAKAAASA